MTFVFSGQYGIFEVALTQVNPGGRAMISRRLQVILAVLVFRRWRSATMPCD